MQNRVFLVLGVVALAGGTAWATRDASARGSFPIEELAEGFSGAMSEAHLTERQISFHEGRIQGDPRAATDRAALASLYLQRSREGGGFDDYRRAEEMARQSLAIRVQQNSRAGRMLAASLLAQHRFVEAHQVAQELVRLWPEEAAHVALLAELQMELGDYESARATLESLVRARDQLSVIPRLARLAELTGQPEEERRLLQLATERAAFRSDLPREQVAWFYLRLAENGLKTGRLEEAESAIRAGLRAEPGDFRLVSAMARLEAGRRQWRRAVAYGAMVGEAADLRTLALIGDAYAQLGDQAAAERFYAKVEESAAETPEPYNRQLYQFRLDHDRRVPETLAILRREIEERKDVLGYDLLAWGLYRAGEHVAAREAAAQALRLGTEDPNFYFHAGLIEHALGNGDGARAYLERALEINPEFHPVLADVARATLDEL